MCAAWTPGSLAQESSETIREAVQQLRDKLAQAWGREILPAFSVHQGVRLDSFVEVFGLELHGWRVALHSEFVLGEEMQGRSVGSDLAIQGSDSGFVVPWFCCRIQAVEQSADQAKSAHKVAEPRQFNQTC